ncbi:restriction endonuclease subunit S [Hoylesella timonensis]|jgi:hypothetical protein|uniref:Type I restriction modification DNA specificity domain-containing protein n=2 Tax=Prevotellaceae TaxID=171552 RepID=A0A098YPK4_9BACT|nr:restriction endonuclease subunit S [Hoylesella timonensis]KGI21172.1 hypothetical protein HMPREF9304_11795 [Hoylesella timonensis S9-PR14]
MVSTANPIIEQSESKRQIDPLLLPSPLRFCTISLSQMQRNGVRLDASAYDIEAIKALNKVYQNLYGWVYLWGKNGLVKDAYYGPRAKRNYLPKGVPFLGSSEMLEIKPIPQKFVDKKYTKQYGVKDGQILLSRSGTIGNITYVNNTLRKCCISEHAIRISAENAGYIYAFFATEIGKAIVRSFTYGAVVDEIEPEHLCNIPIPNAPEEIKRLIHEAIVASYDLRDQSNALIDEAQQLLYDALQIPERPNLTPQYYAPEAGFRNYTVPLSKLNNRLDASYHLPEVDEIINLISKYAKEVTTLGDPRISKDIILPGRFKRIYVEKEQGVPFFGGKQLLQLNPSGEKYLSFGKHADRIEKELSLEENMCLITRSGTIGKIMIVPKHWTGWVANEHCLRLSPRNKDLAGYIYAWLSTNYALPLIVRHTYGAVVDEIDDKQLAEVPIPLLQDEAIQQRINDLVLQANELRYQACLKEQEAIKKMESIL